MFSDCFIFSHLVTWHNKLLNVIENVTDTLENSVAVS